MTTPDNTTTKLDAIPEPIVSLAWQEFVYRREMETTWRHSRSGTPGNMTEDEFLFRQGFHAISELLADARGTIARIRDILRPLAGNVKAECPDCQRDIVCPPTPGTYYCSTCNGTGRIPAPEPSVVEMVERVVGKGTHLMLLAAEKSEREALQRAETAERERDELRTKLENSKLGTEDRLSGDE